VCLRAIDLQQPSPPLSARFAFACPSRHPSAPPSADMNTFLTTLFPASASSDALIPAYATATSAPADEEPELAFGADVPADWGACKSGQCVIF
jgi:hypothetical protein